MIEAVFETLVAPELEVVDEVVVDVLVSSVVVVVSVVVQSTGASTVRPSLLPNAQ